MNARQRVKTSETFSIRLTPTQKRAVQKASCASGLSMNAYIVAAVQTAIEERKELAAFVANTRARVGFDGQVFHGGEP